MSCFGHDSVQGVDRRQEVFATYSGIASACPNIILLNGMKNGTFDNPKSLILPVVFI